MNQKIQGKALRNVTIAEVENRIWDRNGIKKGKEIFFLCPLPLHQDKNPSCRWNTEKHVWYCDVCGIGGGWRALASLLGLLNTRGAYA